MNDNLRLWNLVEKTNPKYTKQFKGKGGFKGTAISAQYQVKKATEQLGIFGKDWGISDESFEKLDIGGKDDLLIYKATLWYNMDGEKCSFPIAADVELFTYSHTYKSYSRNNDPIKKVKTDALTKGLSMLGFNADVFLGMYDDNKYITEVKEEFKKADANKVVEEALKEVDTSGDEEGLKSVWNKYKFLQTDAKFTEAVRSKKATFVENVAA